MAYLPAAIVFSKTFLSFSKDISVCNHFLSWKNNNNNLSKVRYILEKDDNIDYSLTTHSDIEKVPFSPGEKEVLFYPFSTFEVKDIYETNFGEEKIYEIKLLYLGKYLKEIESDKELIKKAEHIPDSEFKKIIVDSGLIEEEKITDVSNLVNRYEKYKIEIKKDKKKME